MARADLLCDLIKYGLINDSVNFRKAVEAICAEERAKQHGVLANKIEELLTHSKPVHKEVPASSFIRNGVNEQTLIFEKTPNKRLSDLFLPASVVDSCNEIVEEQLRGDLLRSYGLEPRNKILLVGPPGNGKTSLAEAVAESLSIPLFTVRYESIVGSYLGETANKLSELFEYARSKQCVLFFDEFETLGKERGDVHETGEIKRVVSSLLLHIDSLPSYVIVIGATNHEGLLDKAVWRRFQIKFNLPKPKQKELEKFYSSFEKKWSFNFGVSNLTLSKKTLGFSFAECEELALSIYRQYVLNLPNPDIKKITESTIKLWSIQVKNIGVPDSKEGEI